MIDIKKNSLKENIIYNILYQLLLIITPLITSPYVSRVLGANGVGIFSYTYSFASCFALFGLLGVTNYGNRTIASVQQDKEKRNEIFCNIFSVQVLTSTIAIIIYMLCIISGDSKYKTALLLQTFTVICSLVDINWYFFGIEKFKLTVIRNSIIKLLNIILIFLFVKKESDINIYILIIAISMLLSNLSVWPFLYKEIDFIKPNFQEMLKHFKSLIILFIPIIAITLYNRMDKIMIGILSSMEQTGLYENTEKIINIPKSFITAIGTVMLPRMTNLYSTGKHQLSKQYLDRTMEFTCFIASAMVFGIAGIANEFAPWFFGDEFADVALLLIVIVSTIFFVSWANVIRTQYLIPLNKDTIYIISVWLGAIGNLIINFLLIPRWGALGATIGTVIAEFLVVFYQSYSVRKELDISYYIKNSIGYIIAGVIMLFFIRLVSNIGTGGLETLSIEVIIGGCIYLTFSSITFIRNHKFHLRDIKYILRK